ncbi:hypothetical protein EYF80_026985 [Liparis tanakae]|uniref:Uncharacterized protein n=1 Tax=Liparis tanakae TaxID=230148 RepID=A0A4Z2HAC3_9TELE|nr:hypothetical protein EYF80_026985 [Liparis tanakae]
MTTILKPAGGKCSNEPVKLKEKTVSSQRGQERWIVDGLVVVHDLTCNPAEETPTCHSKQPGP